MDEQRISNNECQYGAVNTAVCGGAENAGHEIAGLENAKHEAVLA